MVMAGRVIIGLTNADGQQKIDLNYLAVWRREDGKWRFLAWQSAQKPLSQVRSPSQSAVVWHASASDRAGKLHPPRRTKARTSLIRHVT